MSAPEGYRTPIEQALWSRHKTYDMLHQWFVAWVGLAFLVIAMALVKGGWKVGIAATVVCGGIFVGLQYLTRVDDQWDELGAHDFGQRYQYLYDTE